MPVDVIIEDAIEDAKKVADSTTAADGQMGVSFCTLVVQPTGGPGRRGVSRVHDHNVRTFEDPDHATKGAKKRINDCMAKIGNQHAPGKRDLLDNGGTNHGTIIFVADTDAHADLLAETARKSALVRP